MANYYRVSPKFWPWARRRNLTDSQVALALYLLTTEHRNLEGLYRLPKLYISADLGWPAKKVDENLAAVVATGFAEYDENAEMILIPKALKHQAPTTEKQIAGAIAQIERIPRSTLWDAFRMACESHCPRLADAMEKRWPSNTDAIGVSRAGALSSSSSSSSSLSSAEPEREEACARADLASQVVAVLRQCERLRIEPVGVENAIAAWPGRDALRAAHTVVTWATDPTFRSTNAARLLGDALGKQADAAPSDDKRARTDRRMASLRALTGDDL